MRLLIIMTSLAFILTACSGKESRIEKYYQSGESHYKNSNCTKAKLEYKNVLQIDPNIAQAYVGLGKCLLDQQIYIGAYGNFIRALSIDENNIEARIYVAKLLILTQQFTEARNFIQEILSLDPSNASGIALRGLIELRTNNDEQALHDANLALAGDAENLEAITLKTLLLIGNKNNHEAIELLEQTLKKQEISLRKSKEFRLILVSLYEQMNEHLDTVQIYQSLTNDFPNEIPYINALAREYAKNNQLDEARSIYTSRLEDDYHPDIILEFIAFVVQFEGRDEAFTLLKEYAAEEKITGKVRLALAREYLFQKDRDTALSILNKLAGNKNIAEQMDAINEIAFLHIKDGNIDEALERVNQVLSQQPNNIRALIARGKISKSNNDYSQAIADFRVVVRTMPGNKEAIKELSETYVLDQQPELAKKLIIDTYENNGIDRALAEIYVGLAQGKTEISQAIDFMNEIYQQDKTSQSAFSTLFNLHLQNQDTIKARQMINEIDVSFIDTPLAHYHAAMLNLAENNQQQAVVDLKKTIAVQRTDVALKTLIGIYISNDNKSEAISYLQNMIATDYTYTLPYVMLADIFINDKDIKSAQTYLEQALEIDTESAALYQRLATLISIDGNVDEGIAIIKKGLEATNEPEMLAVDLALSQYRIGRRSDAITTLSDALRKVPDSVMIKTQLAYILADEQTDSKQLAQALDLIKQVQDSDLIQVQSAVGWVNYKAGDYERAIIALKNALKQSPNNAELNYQLGIALMDGGSHAEAEIFLARASSSEGDFKDKQDAVARLKQLKSM